MKWNGENTKFTISIRKKHLCINNLRKTSKTRTKPGMVAHAYNAITQKAEVGELEVQSQPGLYDVFKDSLGYIARSSIKSKPKQANNRKTLKKKKGGRKLNKCVSFPTIRSSSTKWGLSRRFHSHC